MGMIVGELNHITFIWEEEVDGRPEFPKQRPYVAGFKAWAKGTNRHSLKDFNEAKLQYLKDYAKWADEGYPKKKIQHRWEIPQAQVEYDHLPNHYRVTARQLLNVYGKEPNGN